MSTDGDGAKQKFELYIKASAIDKETKGSCPICQHWFMITCLLGENQDDIDFKVYTVQADCPPKNFGVDQGWSKKFPVVMVLEGHDKKGQDLSGTKYDTFEELETFFESINKECRELKRHNAPNVSAMKAVEDVYNAFNGFLSGKGPKRLTLELKKINEFLESEEESKFLVDDVLSFADCYLLPRLQHIRVAGKAYMDFDIPEEHTAIWKYLVEAYKTEAFRSTMPSDQDIVFHYEKKVSGALIRPKRSSRPTLQNFTYTLDVPEAIAATLNAAGSNNTNGDVSKEPTTDGRIEISPQPESDASAAHAHVEDEAAKGVEDGVEHAIVGIDEDVKHAAGIDGDVKDAAGIDEDAAASSVGGDDNAVAADDSVKDVTDQCEFVGDAAVTVEDDTAGPPEAVADDVPTSEAVPTEGMKADDVTGDVKDKAVDGDVQDASSPPGNDIQNDSVPDVAKNEVEVAENSVNDDNNITDDAKIDAVGIKDDDKIENGTDDCKDKEIESVKAEDVKHVADEIEKAAEPDVTPKANDADEGKEVTE